MTFQQVKKWFKNKRSRVFKKPEEYFRLPSCISQNKNTLLKFYASNNSTNKNEKKILAKNKNFTYNQILSWFAKRRFIEKSKIQPFLFFLKIKDLFYLF